MTDLPSTHSSRSLHLSPGPEVFKQDRFGDLWFCCLFLSVGFCLFLSVRFCLVVAVLGVVVFSLLFAFPTYLFAEPIHLPGISRSFFLSNISCRIHRDENIMPMSARRALLYFQVS